MNLLHLLLTVVSVTMPVLVWRALLLDHEKLLVAVKKIPVLGSALSCGFCTAVWSSLIGTLIHNPVAGLLPDVAPAWELGIGWCVVATGVLILRNFIALLMEATGVLTDIHRRVHEEEK